jgi:hypothetical protein
MYVVVVVGGCGLEKIHTIKKIPMPSFKINFSTEKETEAEAGGGGGGGRGIETI